MQLCLCPTAIATSNVFHIQRNTIDFILTANVQLLIVVDTKKRPLSFQFCVKFFLINADWVEPFKVVLVTNMHVQLSLFYNF
jgi:hypothetical protein